MDSFFGKKSHKGLSKHELLFQRDIPYFLLEIVRKYFRLDIEGIEHVPAKGRGLIVPNHSGVTALDAVMIGHEIFRDINRVIKVLAHPMWFVGPNIRVLAKRMGLAEASKQAGEKLLRGHNLVLIFPEGEAGNFKPTAERYKLREFRRGFVRMAIATGSPIIPTVVIGAEETNINLSQLSLTKVLKGVVIPVPLNVLPLPAKWKIVFLPPISTSQYKKEDANNRELVYKLASEVQRRIQARIDEEINSRQWIYFPKGSSRQTAKRSIPVRSSGRSRITATKKQRASKKSTQKNRTSKRAAKG